MSGIVKISEFRREKDIVDDISKLRFFNHFKQCKFFTAWKLWVRRVTYRRAYGIISGSAVFSDDLLVTTLFEIRNIAYEIRDEIDLFHYNPEGGLLWSCDYFESQIDKIKRCGLDIFVK